MEVLLAFLVFVFVAGIRAKRDAPMPRRAVLLLMSLLVTMALMSHRLA